MVETSAPRSLADQLRSWADDDLALLVASRPDLATPAPQDSGQLASRAGTRASATRAVNELTALELVVLEAVVDLGADTGLPAIREVVQAPEDAVDDAVERLLALALVWGNRERLRPLGVLAEVVGTNGRRLGPQSGAVGEPPTLATSQRDRAAVDRAAAGAAFELVRRVELLLERWGTRPPSALRGGGLGVRDLRAVAELLHVEVAQAALHVEVAHATGLLAVGTTEEEGSAWLPTDTFDIWNAGSVADRWTRLALAWLDMPRLVGLVGARDEKGRTVNALAAGLERGWLPETRRTALGELASLPDGEVLAPGTGVASLVDRVRWLRPRRPRERGQAVGWVLDEAAVLGVAALGGLARHGAELLAAADPWHAAPAALEPLLPEPVDHVLLQADLTAVAPGPLEQELGQRLQLVADVESRGGATVYRFTAASVRRAFDAGWSAAEIHDFVARASRTAVPQPLVYLVDDVARRFGTLRVGTAESFLRSDDESTLAELLHQPKAGSLRLRRIAPTVLVSDLPPDLLLPRLRELGAAPVVESADGTVQVARRDVHRARAPRNQQPSEARTAVRTTARVTATVAAIRAGDRAAASRPRRPGAGGTRASPAAVLAALQEAADAKATVWIGYVDNHGSTQERVVDPVHVHAGQLTAYDHRSEDVALFAVHRITGVHQAAAP